jgi:pyruvate dehydrogenase E2 component (dihydrolipoamide acetyltransferase)
VADVQSIAAAATDSDAFVDTPAGSMRRTIARRLTESKTTVPHFYMTRHLEIDALLALRAQVNRDREQRVSVNDLVVKAVALAHRAVPEANAIWIDGTIRRFRDVDVAVAVAIDGGLVTPVIRGVDALSVAGLAERTAAAAERARTGGLLPGELEGGSIAVSNLGMYGIDDFAAIINPPQSGILAVGAGTQRAIVRDGEITVATVMSVTLSGDHRVLDGAVAARWMGELAALIENPMRILAG